VVILSFRKESRISVKQLKSELHAYISDKDFAPAAEYFTAHAAPCIRFRDLGGFEDAPIGATRFGGDPDLPLNDSCDSTIRCTRVDVEPQLVINLTRAIRVRFSVRRDACERCLVDAVPYFSASFQHTSHQLAHDQRQSRIKQILNHKVTFDRVGERVVYFMLPGTAFVVSLAVSVVCCYFFCPRDHIFLGIVVAVSLIPGITGCFVWLLVHMIWWKRYQEVDIWFSGRGSRQLFFFAGVILIGVVLLL